MAFSLPRPIGRQREVLYLPADGHTVVLGTAGSGKTTLAILRSLFLSDPSTDHGGRTLLVTFNRCLVTYMRHLAGASQRLVVVENYHLFARGYLSFRGKLPDNSICKREKRLGLIRLLLYEAQTDGVRSSILRNRSVPLAGWGRGAEWLRADINEWGSGLKAAARALAAETRQPDRPS